MKSKYLVIALACLTSASFATRIGVLKKDANFKCKEQIKIDLDVEDSHNRTGVKNDTDPNPPGISLGGHAVFTYCALNVSSMPKISYDYAVLALDEECPAGTYMFMRHHDTEDSHNANSHSGNIYPNVVNSNATLVYCFVPADESSSKQFPSFDKNNGDKYGVFANPDMKKVSSKVKHSEVYIDDEDNRNDHWEWYTMQYLPIVVGGGFTQEGNSDYWCYPSSTPNRIVKKMKNIMNGEDNTTYHVVKWTGAANDLKKSSVVDESMPLVAAAPTAPAIKGLNRSIVSVELKSAGDVKVSVVGINGAVLANVTEKNLQPGDHQIKWNSGMVPSGRYIVKIEQNGMVNAKNVILK